MKGSFENVDVNIVSNIVEGFKNYVPMFHNHMEIVYVLDGELNLCIDGLRKKLTKNELSISFPYSIHSYEETENVTTLRVLFSPRMVKPYEKELYSNKPLNPYITNGEDILPLLLKIKEHFKTDKKLTVAYLTAVIGEILKRLELREAVAMDFSAVQQVLTYCSEHYREPVTIKSVATALFLSESYISKIFSNKIYISFRDYISDLRISEAKKMLEITDAKITDIMYSCGFNNQSSFNRIFCDKTGCTPTEYRKKLNKL